MYIFRSFGNKITTLKTELKKKKYKKYQSAFNG